MTHGLEPQKAIWEMEVARVLQLMQCKSIMNGATLRYSKSVDDIESNEKLESIERAIEQWQSEQK